MHSGETANKQDESLNNIFVTDHLYLKQRDFRHTAKYSKPFESFKAFLEYLKNKQININAITNKTAKVPITFKNMLIAGFPFKSTKGFTSYLNRAIQEFFPIFIISHQDVPCDLIKLPEEWETNREIHFPFFIMGNEVKSPKFKGLPQKYKKLCDVKGGLVSTLIRESQIKHNA